MKIFEGRIFNGKNTGSTLVQLLVFSSVVLSLGTSVLYFTQNMTKKVNAARLKSNVAGWRDLIRTSLQNEARCRNVIQNSIRLAGGPLVLNSFSADIGIQSLALEFFLNDAASPSSLNVGQVLPERLQVASMALRRVPPFPYRTFTFDGAPPPSVPPSLPLAGSNLVYNQWQANLEIQFRRTEAAAGGEGRSAGPQIEFINVPIRVFTRNVGATPDAIVACYGEDSVDRAEEAFCDAMGGHLPPEMYPPNAPQTRASYLPYDAGMGSVVNPKCSLGYWEVGGATPDAAQAMNGPFKREGILWVRGDIRVHNKRVCYSENRYCFKDPAAAAPLRGAQIWQQGGVLRIVDRGISPGAGIYRGNFLRLQGAP